MRSERLQYSVVGHYLPFFGKNTDRANGLVLQWYIDNIMSLHKAQPSRLELVTFFLQLDASDFGESPCAPYPL